MNKTPFEEFNASSVDEIYLVINNNGNDVNSNYPPANRLESDITPLCDFNQLTAKTRAKP